MNGAKQGGKFSLALFNVYMNDLGFLLNPSEIRGSLKDNLNNHIYNADDLCLIALSLSGIKHFFDLCDLLLLPINYLTKQQFFFSMF